MSDKQKVVFILAGGTGGHIYPAMAVAELLAKKNVRIIWLGTKNGLESKIQFPDFVEIEWIKMTGVVGNGIMSWITMPFRLMSAVRQVLKLVKKYQPNLMFGTGGFVAAPGGIAAYMKGIALIVHESNAVAGLTNKYLSKIATKTLTSVADTKDIFGDIEVIGNPVRQSIVKAFHLNEERAYKQDKLCVAIVGGSQGAKVFNEVLPQAISSISSQSLIIKHQTGKGKNKGIEQEYKKYNKDNQHDVEVLEYIDDMASLYKQADIMICRAGAMSLTEVSLASLPAIVIPFPHSAGEHQLANAKYYKKQHAAVLIEQDQFDIDSAKEVIEGLIKNREKLKLMSKQSKLIAKPNAAEDAARICWETMNA